MLKIASYSAFIQDSCSFYLLGFVWSEEWKSGRIENSERIENSGRMEKWENRKKIIFSPFCLGGSGKVEAWKK